MRQTLPPALCHKLWHNLRLAQVAASVLLALLSASAWAGEGRLINPVTDVCWSCMFPLTVSGVNTTPGHKDLSKTTKRICICAGTPPKVGIPITFWEPRRLVDVTRCPYKLIALGGINIQPDSLKRRGTVARAPDGMSQSSFYHVHWYEFPVMAILGLLDDFACVEKSKETDLAYLSEYDPTWNDDRLALILGGEAALFANPLAQVACIPDCLASTLKRPLDKLFWCAGCQGSLYPHVGTVSHHVGSLQATSLLVHRLIAKLHRIGSLKGYGKDDFCQARFMPIIKKSLYKTQLVYPICQTKAPCQALGKSDLSWNLGRPLPLKGESFVYLVWTKKHCCLDGARMAATAGGI